MDGSRIVDEETEFQFSIQHQMFGFFGEIICIYFNELIHYTVPNILFFLQELLSGSCSLWEMNLTLKWTRYLTWWAFLRPEMLECKSRWKTEIFWTKISIYQHIGYSASLIILTISCFVGLS